MAATLSVPVSVATEKGKEPRTGNLEVHDVQLRWIPEGQAPVLLHIVQDIHDMFVSKKPADKPGKPRMKLDLRRKGALASWFIDFADWGERDRLVERLKDIRAKAAAGGPSPQEGFQPEVPLPDGAAERALALSSDPELRALHRDVVGGGLMAEEDFWHDPQRKRLLEAMREKTKAQATGMRSSFFTADLPRTRASNHITFHLDKQIIADIFRELPQVKAAFMDRVPEKMSEVQFWEAFFKSHHFNRQEKRKDDIFLEAAPATGIPKMSPLADDPSLALHRTEEFAEGYGLKDYERAPAVPGQAPHARPATHVVIEQFNRHSATVLLSPANPGPGPAVPSLSATPAAPTPILFAAPSPVSAASSASSLPPSPAPNAAPLELEPLSRKVAAHSHLDDLEEVEPPLGIPLTVQDRNRYFNGEKGGDDLTTSGRGRKVDASDARRKLLAAMRSLQGGPPVAPAPQQGVVKQEACSEEVAPSVVPFHVTLMDETTRVRTRHVLDDLLGAVCHEGNIAQGAKGKAEAAGKADIERSLDARAGRVMEVLRYFWGISLLRYPTPERQQKLERLTGCMEELHAALAAELAALPATPPDPRQPSLELLQTCLATALERAKQDRWDLQAEQPGATKRPASSLEGPRASVVMRMKSRRTAPT